MLFYSIWKPTLLGFEEAYALYGKQKDSSSGYYKMQDMTSEICNAVNKPSEESTATLIDIRDNNKYTVAKLLDGKCWMTQNLRIQNYNLISQDSDVISSFKINSSSNPSTFNTNDMNHVVYVDSYGGHYTWQSANAGSTESSGDSSTSACPKGWRLPSCNLQDFNLLSSKYPGTELFTSTPSFEKGGYVWSGQHTSIGGTSGYWTSTSAYGGYSGDGTACQCTSSGSAFYCGGGSGKGNGWSVRCIAR